MGLTVINSANVVLRQLTNLKRLNLSSNKLRVIQNLEEGVRQLKELNLGFNQIEKIQNLNLPMLETLTLCNN